jgi:hypothetical protein
VKGLIDSKINAIDMFRYTIINVEMGIEGNHRKENNHYSASKL